MLQLLVPAGPWYPAVQLELRKKQDALPGGLDMPGAHARHTAELLAPTTAEKVFAEQLVHASLPPPENVPGAQGVQLAPYVPGRHVSDM
jgi:hypothetical protein